MSTYRKRQREHEANRERERESPEGGRRIAGEKKADPSHDLVHPVVLPGAQTLTWQPEDMEIHPCQPLSFMAAH